MMVGYARVSTSEQNTDMQLRAFEKAGVSEIHQEKQSAVKARPVLEKLLASMRKGDVLVVYKLDRLARSMTHFVAIFERLRQAGVGFKSLTESIDTESPQGRMMLNLLGVFAEFERELIRERCMAGQRAAIQRGVHCGRPRSLTSEEEADIVRLYQSGQHTYQGLATQFAAHPSAIKRAVYRAARPGHSSLR